MEIVLIQKKNVAAQYPGLFLFTGPARMMRSVKNLIVNKTELIGTFEQIYLNISISSKDAQSQVMYIKFLFYYWFVYSIRKLIYIISELS